MAAHHLKFDGVHGYKTYENAQKRGEEVAAKCSGVDYRWVVIALPNGRFTPMVLVNNSIPGGPGMFLGEINVCSAN